MLNVIFQSLKEKVHIFTHMIPKCLFEHAHLKNEKHICKTMTIK